MHMYIEDIRNVFPKFLECQLCFTVPFTDMVCPEEEMKYKVNKKGCFFASTNYRASCEPTIGQGGGGKAMSAGAPGVDGR